MVFLKSTLKQSIFLLPLLLLLIISFANSPTAVSSTTIPTPTTSDLLIEAINQARWDNGQLPPLKHQSILRTAAQNHSISMADNNFTGHCDLVTGTQAWERIENLGYNGTSWGENILWGFTNIEDGMNWWMNSQLHRDNILTTQRNEIGAGHYYDPNDSGNTNIDYNGDCIADETSPYAYNHYWTLTFGNRPNNFPLIINRDDFSTDQQTVSLYIYGAGTIEEMRFSNDQINWSAWEPFSSDKSWELAAVTEENQLFVELKVGEDIYQSSDQIYYSGTLISLTPTATPVPPTPTATPMPELYSPTDELLVGGMAAIYTRTLNISNIGSNTLYWTATFSPSLTGVSASPLAGSLTGNEINEIDFTIDTQSWLTGTHTTEFIISSLTSDTLNSPLTIPITIYVWDEIKQQFIPFIGNP